MDALTNFHPVYVSGQYLTSEHLNETHEFLWQEEKAGRYLLAGNGIAQGLNISFDDSASLKHVMVSKGAAVTVDGYLVQAPAGIKFDRAVSIDLVYFKTIQGWQQMMEKKIFDALKNLDTIDQATVKEFTAFEMIADTTKDEDLPVGAAAIASFGINPGDATIHHLLLAWVDIVDAENNHCQQGDCNTKGTQRNYKTRYFLADSSLVAQLNVLSAGLSTCSVARIKKISLSGSAAGLNQRSFDAWSKSFAELLPYFSNDPSRNLSAVAKVLPQDDQDALAKSTTSFTKTIPVSVTNTSCPQYYTLFAADLCKAINELVVCFNEYAKKYPSISGNRVERTIIIGGLSSTGIDPWRYYFIKAVDQPENQADQWQLQKLFRRVIAMVDHFIPQGLIGRLLSQVQSKPLAIPTITGDNLLQNTAIPFYFDIQTLTGNENRILKYWNPQGGNLKNIYCYYDTVVVVRNDMANKLSIADWYNQNFFRIEGHLGMPKASAISVINNMIVNDGLPIQLIDCDVNYKGPRKWIDWYTEFVGNLGNWTKDLRKDFKEYDFAPIKNIQAAITQTSYRNVDEVVKVLNDFNAYSGVFYNPPKTPVGNISARARARAAATVVKAGIPTNAYTQFTKVIDKNVVVDLNKKLKDALAEQNELKASKLVVLSDLGDLEYAGGAPRGGTFVLLHDGNNVLGDACLPYYYRINQLRVFNPAVG